MDVHPVIRPVLDWRIYTKLRSTYVEALPALIAADGRVHTTFHQAVAATGRLSSSDPNLQNIPIRTPLGRRIRRAFVAGAPDLVLVAADYSQIELRIIAHVSGDEHLRDAFARGADIHRETAARVLHKAPDGDHADERSMAKMVNFGLAYGMSDFGLSSRAGISRQEAQEFINSYFAAYSGISYYMLHIKETARRDGYVTTLLGRKRQIPELHAANPSLRGAGERMAINMPIQGTAADIVKIAMIRLDGAPGGRGLPGAPAPPGPRRAPPRGAARRGGPPRAGPPRGHGGRADPRRAADGRRQGRRRLGVDDPAVSTGRRAGRGGRGPGGELTCPSCPRSRRSPATCAGWSSTRRSRAPRATGRGRSDARPDTHSARRSPAGGSCAVGRRGEAARPGAVGRRGPDDPPEDDRPAVRGAGGGTGGSVRPARDRVRRRPRAAVPGHPQVRAGSGCTRSIRPTGEAVHEAGGAAVFAGFGPEPLDEAFTLRVFRRRLRARRGRLKPLLLDQGFVAGVGNIYADEALWAARLHPLRSAATLRPPDEGRLYRGDPADPRRGGRAARLVDRRLHGARRRRLHAGAAPRLPARRRAVPALRAAGPADRHRRAGRPTSARGASGSRPATGRARPRSCGG